MSLVAQIREMLATGMSVEAALAAAEIIERGARSRKPRAPREPSDKEQIVAALESVLSPERARAVIAHRAKIKKPLTAHAALLLAKAFGQVRHPDAAADMMISRGWQGFDPSWVNNGRGMQTRPSFAEIAHRFNDEIQDGAYDRDR